MPRKRNIGATPRRPQRLMNDKEYLSTLAGIKEKIREAKNRAVLSVNSELIVLYWNIGVAINERSAWGNKFIENLSMDIKLDFPDAKGYSARNLKYMAKFAREYPDFEIVQTLSAQITWSHNVLLLDKVKDENHRVWYARRAAENGWSVRTLDDQIDYKLYERQALPQKATNFKKRLEPSQSRLAERILKDPYMFDFIAYREGMAEREIEKELTENVAKLLIELGKGFAFVGNQYRIEVEKKDFYIDLLFYHLDLRCFIAIELKRGDFKPEHAGKLNFYVSAIDDLLKTEHDNPTIGLLLCKSKEGMIAEYSLQDIEKPIGVSEFKLFGDLPEKYKDLLPSAEDIEKRVNMLMERK